MPKFIVVFIALPYSRNENLEAPPFAEALQRLEEAINNAYSRIRRRYPDIPLVIVCQEYCIFGNDVPSKRKNFLNNAQRIAFKNSMRGLLVGKHNFTLVPGTIAYFRNIFYKPRFSEQSVKERFTKAKAKHHVFCQSEIKAEEAQADAAFALGSPYGIKNLCYIFQTPITQRAQTEEEVIIYKHEKISTCFEWVALDDGPDCAIPRENRFFQPGFDTTIINFGGDFKLAIEICAEHVNGILEQQVREGLIEKPDLDLVISDYIPCRYMRSVGAVTVFADARNFNFSTPHDDHEVIICMYGSSGGRSKLMRLHPQPWQTIPEPKKELCLLM